MADVPCTLDFLLPKSQPIIAGLPPRLFQRDWLQVSVPSLDFGDGNDRLHFQIGIVRFYSQRYRPAQFARQLPIHQSRLNRVVPKHFDNSIVRPRQLVFGYTGA